MAEPSSQTQSGSAASLLMVGFHGHTVGPELRAFVAEGPPAGVILFARNIASTEQVARLTRELRALWPAHGPPPLIAVDQEGGRVRRLRAPATPEVSPWPTMRQVGQTGTPRVAEAIGEVLGAQLAAMGFNLDFAPVLDVDSNPDNPVIGARSFATDPDSVAAMGIAFARGIQRQGVAACGKHFPGHGDTAVDSHLALPTLPHSRERLERLELAPFRAAVASGEMRCIMTAHIVFSALDAETPATLSPHVIPTLLRQGLGFDGVVVSDDLEMAAIADHYDADAIARGGLGADVDLFLICHRLDRARRVRDALAREASPERLKRSVDRLKALRTSVADHAASPWSGRIPEQDRGTRVAQQHDWPTAQTEASQAAASKSEA